MSYFGDKYSLFRYPIEGEGTPGFRPAQLGAIHAAAGHFEMRSDPGVVTMPTGSGKTAVLAASAFVLRARRVLIIVPSRLVREQIAEEIGELVTLKATGAVPEDLECPKVFNTKSRIKTHDEWEALREYDVVVATIQSVSPGYHETPEPPEDLFDLVLVDEAHHSPARTWAGLLQHYSNAKQLLFTATPFRQDQKEIRGRFIYTYHLKRAYDDGIFGQINYSPVTPEQHETNDVAIAKAAEKQFTRDQETGHNHRLMVRTDSLKRAQELSEIYQANTGLRLSVVSGNKLLRLVKGIIRDLEDGNLDGIICVNMLGEGFNFPSLKIAAIHSPHKSLSVTLQFIGRFARTVGDDLGEATFLAVPSEIEIEAERLYDSRSVWQELVQNLSAARVHQEAEVREVLESFDPLDVSNGDLSDLSLYVLEPYFHVKVFQLEQPIDLRETIEIPNGYQIVFETMSAEHNALAFIAREIAQPRWTADDRLASVRHDLFIYYLDSDTNMLFVCASRRTAGVYDTVAKSVAVANPKPLPLSRLNKAMNDLTAPEFFNVGMRNRVATSTTESYRIIAGSNADKAIQKSDGRLYHRGHVFGRASDDGELVTIGISSASKIWSNRAGKLPELIEWCKTLARRMASNANPTGGSGLDHLSVGEELDTLPGGIISVDWPVEAFKKNFRLIFRADEDQFETQMLDTDLTIISDQTDEDKVMVQISYNERTYNLTYSFETDRLFEPDPGNTLEVDVVVENDEIPVISFLNDNPLEFYTSDLSRIFGFNILRAKNGVDPFDLGQLEIKNWTESGVDIQNEFDDATENGISIQQHVGELLGAVDSPAEVAYCDHGTGEIADFVSFERKDGRLLVRLMHCKKSAEANPGHRVNDVYEVASQSVKNVKWARKQLLTNRIRYRHQNNKGSADFIKGNLNNLEQLMDEFAAAQIDFEMVVVQPGLRKEGIPEHLQNNLASASDFIVRGGYLPLRVWCS